jgi:hypothetical protein
MVLTTADRSEAASGLGGPAAISDLVSAARTDRDNRLKPTAIHPSLGKEEAKATLNIPCGRLFRGKVDCRFCEAL